MEQQEALDGGCARLCGAGTEQGLWQGAGYAAPDLNRYVLDQRGLKPRWFWRWPGSWGGPAVGCWLRRGPGGQGTGRKAVAAFPSTAASPVGARALEDQAPEGYAAADVADGGGYCYLRVAGEELSSAGIRPGDLVLLRLQESAKTASWRPARWAWSRASQRYSQQGEFIILQPEHPASQPPASCRWRSSSPAAPAFWGGGAAGARCEKKRNYHVL